MKFLLVVLVLAITFCGGAYCGVFCPQINGWVHQAHDWIQTHSQQH